MKTYTPETLPDLPLDPPEADDRPTRDNVVAWLRGAIFDLEMIDKFDAPVSSLITESLERLKLTLATVARPNHLAPLGIFHGEKPERVDDRDPPDGWPTDEESDAAGDDYKAESDRKANAREVFLARLSRWGRGEP